MEDITPRERALFKVIRQRIGRSLQFSAINTEFSLKRFLLGEEYDLEKIVPRLKRYLCFRNYLDNYQGLDETTNAFLFKNYLPTTSTEQLQDVEQNYLVQIIPLGKIDWRGVLNTVPSSTLVRFGTRIVEETAAKLRKLEKCSGERSEGIVWIVDMEGVELDCWTIRAWNGPLESFFKFLLVTYAELTRHILIINCNRFIFQVWRFFASFLPRNVFRKLRILSREHWTMDLNIFIDTSSLPTHWGGNVVHNYVHIPQPVSLSAFYRASMDEPAEVLLEQRTIAGKSSYVEELCIGQLNTNLMWYFKTDGPITFAIFYCADNLFDFSNSRHFDINSLDIDTSEVSEVSKGILKAESGKEAADTESDTESRKVEYEYSSSKDTPPFPTNVYGSGKKKSDNGIKNPKDDDVIGEIGRAHV